MVISPEEYFQILSRLDTSLDSLLTFICTRNCCNWHLPNPGPGNFEQVFWSHHSYTGLSKHIWSGKHLTEEQILKYENDIKHGVAHGICTYLSTTLQSTSIPSKLMKRTFDSYDSNFRLYDKDEYDTEVAEYYYNNTTDGEKLVPCCLFHDMYRCFHDTDQHDRLLKEYLPHLDPVVYTHSTPSTEHESHPLIKGDRFELLRYDNASEWVDLDRVFSNVSDHDKKLIQFFYKRMRPVLEKCFKFRDDRWIRHGIEDQIENHDFTATMYPTLSTVENVDKFIVDRDINENYWAVELAKGSLGPCITHKLDNRKMSICKPGYRGRATFAWELLQGKIPLREYKQHLNSCKVRDHLYGHGQLPIDDWIFTHKDIQYERVEPVLKSDLKICHDKIVHKFLHLSEKIIDLLYGIKVELS